MSKTNVLLRLPAELHDEIRDLAEGELRSVNSQIVTLLREALDAREMKGGKGSRAAVPTGRAAVEHQLRYGGLVTVAIGSDADRELAQQQGTELVERREDAGVAVYRRQPSAWAAAEERREQTDALVREARQRQASERDEANRRQMAELAQQLDVEPVKRYVIRTVPPAADDGEDTGGMAYRPRQQ